MFIPGVRQHIRPDAMVKRIKVGTCMMDIKIKRFLPAILLVLSFCSVDSFLKLKETDKFTYYGTKPDSITVHQLDKLLEENFRRICNDLEYDYKFRITVEIYPDQKSFDANTIGTRGTPAVSGNRTIQMVSPFSAIKIQGIPYEERLLMAVHEFVHLVNNEINNNMPLWIEEGLATYEGSFNFYKNNCLKYFKSLPEISFEQLDQNYQRIRGADLYSYTLIYFIAQNFGKAKLCKLIRNPDDIEEILMVSRKDITSEWNLFIKENFRK